MSGRIGPGYGAKRIRRSRSCAGVLGSGRVMLVGLWIARTREGRVLVRRLSCGWAQSKGGLLVANMPSGP